MTQQPILIKQTDKEKLLKEIKAKIDLLFSLYDDEILRLEANQHKKMGGSKINIYKIEHFK